LGKKIKLELTPDFDFILIGIVSFDQDYKLCWELNRELEMDFEKTEDHVLLHKKSGLSQDFSCFSFDDSKSYLSYKILKNRSENGYLLDALKNLDYLLVITGDIDNFPIDRFRSELVKLQSIQSCFKISPGEVKNVERVL